MGKGLRGLVAGVALTVLALFVLRSGFVDIKWPWEVDLATTELEYQPSDEARIASVEPITLDCRARVRAVVPVEGVRRHRLLGQVYRTDRMTMQAIGDVDTCVEGDGVEVHHHDDGSTEVVVPAGSIVFNRPRVDAVATADSVTADKGMVGKVTDVFPWVDEGSGLVPHAYAYAQQVIGGSSCMRAAYRLTAEALIEGYRGQFVEQGLDPDRLEVRIEGEPDFGQSSAPAPSGDVEFSVAADEARCEPAAEGAGAVEQPSR